MQTHTPVTLPWKPGHEVSSSSTGHQQRLELRGRDLGEIRLRDLHKYTQGEDELDTLISTIQNPEGLLKLPLPPLPRTSAKAVTPTSARPQSELQTIVSRINSSPRKSKSKAKSKTRFGRELLLLMSCFALIASVVTAAVFLVPQVEARWLPALLAGLGSLVFLPLLPVARRVSTGSLLLVFITALAATWLLRLGIPASLSFDAELSQLLALATELWNDSIFSKPQLVLLGAESLVFALLLVANRSSFVKTLTKDAHG